MKNNRRIINETLESKVKSLYEKIRHQEMEEGRDHYDIEGDYNPREFKTIRDRKKFFKPDDDTSGVSMKRKQEKDIEDLLNKLGDDYEDYDDDDIELTEMKGETCECGGEMKEGECMECGYMKEEDDYITEEDDDDEYSSRDKEFGIGPDVDDEEVARGYCVKGSPKYNEIACKATEGINERFYGKQRKLDKNKNNRIDSEDFKLLRKGKKKSGETNEKFPDLSGDGKVTRKDILMGRGVKLGNKKSKVKEGFEYHIQDSFGDIIKLSENEMVDLIENIVNEQSGKLKNLQKPRGMVAYEKAHKQSGMENSDSMKSVTKKMNDYLKDGSKAKYEDNPKHFPKGNGELAKMDKKAYKASDAVQDYIDNFTAAGLENLDYDGISPNEEWVSDLVKGSSRTGNNPKWANAVETENNSNRDKIRKNNLLGKLKKKAYNKAPQPFYKDEAGEGEGDKIMNQLESMSKKEKNQINEEFDRIKNLFSYNRKTQ